MKRNKWLFMGLAALLAACVTVNIYFPAAEVERAADKIVDDVYGVKPTGNGDEKGKPDGPSQGSLIRLLAEFLEPADAHAQEAVSVSNATIRGLKNQLGENHRQLRPFYDQGNVGIDRNGYLVLRDTQGLPLQQLALLKRLVNEDNSLRKQLYREVAKALNVASDQVDRIEAIFAGHWRQKALSGWWVQRDDGSWVRN